MLSMAAYTPYLPPPLIKFVTKHPKQGTQIHPNPPNRLVHFPPFLQS